MRKTWLLVLMGVLVVGAGAFVVARPAPGIVASRLSAVAAASGNEDPRWQRVTGPRAFSFPQDHGPHPAYQTEWWYYTGNLLAEDGREFGFQLTFFRRGLDPEPPRRSSRWATRDIYMAHFTVSDLAGERFYAAERFSRDGAGLAGAQGNPYRVWLGEWQATGSGPQSMSMRLQARHEEVAIDLRLESTKPPTLQGDRGYSVKGQDAGNASYYYSLTRMATTGTVAIGAKTYRITGGTSWMDHEWGTSRLEAGGVGWDWFGLQLSDGREITWGQLRRADGTITPESFGTVTAADGSTTRLGAQDVTLDVVQHWTSPRSGARYPTGWRLRIPKAGLDLRIKPRMADQELPLSITYWEGAVAIEGQSGSVPVSGRGYVELTGYLESEKGREIR